IAEIKRQLAPQLPANYRMSAELYVESRDYALVDKKTYRPDLGIVESDYPKGEADRVSYNTLTPPTLTTTKSDLKQRFLTIQDASSNSIVTVIEVLSPTNKETTGLVNYQRKRNAYINAVINLIEIDLLRGGEKPYWRNAWPEASYHILSTLGGDQVNLWAIQIEEVLPTIPVPLRYGELPMVLDLQRCFAEVYAISSFDRRYRLEALDPPPTPRELEFLKPYVSR
ncbi:MAG: DUF4058 family protein, partial [Bacteroidota bacterium]